VEPFDIRTDDDYLLGATLYSAGDSAKLVLIIPASATPQRYYRRFALYLQDKGYNVLTFDYRGIGEFLHGNIRLSEATMSDWGKHDLRAVIDWTATKYSHLYAVGHSVAGQILPLSGRADKFEKIYLVASQNTSMYFWRGYPKLLILLFWYLVIPAMLRFFGYLPGWAVGGKTPLPGPAAREWRAWGTHPEGMVYGQKDRAKVFADVLCSMHFMAVADDKVFAPEMAVRKLMAQYKNADVSFELLYPGEFDLQTIGHFGFFRKTNKVLWQKVLEYFSE
jgi:predicted alpha/beta hydrolase